MGRYDLPDPKCRQLSEDKEAAMSEAVEALLACDHHVFLEARAATTGYRCECGVMFGVDRAAAYLHERTEMVRALLSPSVTTCETCGGKRWADVEQEENGLYTGFRCTTCNGSGQVTRPSIAVLRGELTQEAWMGTKSGFVWPSRGYPDSGSDSDVVALYRIASGEHK